MTKADKIRQFDPNGIAMQDANIFGLPFTADESDIILIPVPWEVTVSYSSGTARGPAAILEASSQVDLYDADAPEVWKNGIYLLEENQEIAGRSIELRDRAERHIQSLSSAGTDDKNEEVTKAINDASETMIAWVKNEAAEWLGKGKIVGLLGGDHSTPLGFMQALAERYPDFGILQLDAHCDLRDAYEGFQYSHASIMFNALKIPAISKLVQVGIRDYCQAEADIISASAGRIKTFFDADLKSARFEGDNWKQQVEKIIAELPQFVYVSFDIDGLDPKLCPGTGTPVAGGMEYHEAVYLLKMLAKSGKTIIGFDLNEVAPGENEWDANVGARLLLKLCVFAGISKGLFSN